MDLARGPNVRSAAGASLVCMLKEEYPNWRIELEALVYQLKKHGYFLAIMIAKLEEYLDIFYKQDFHDICISAKSMDASLVIDAYTEIAARFD